ncbi:xanthine dehydrogenase small subunit [Neptunomonas qingdaonensis]|uniref:Xanthine dehydrogenase small subunit n=1 Tax=Neptunomonas qingdaonensis TaxID=1045558 RepID=A0A1I2P949_9GAMM|nr:xanthine dehydrogenase small subunit [Neptunomonas qingdaonensis]SFG12675.1 xanthine dehydrogenase small subunit [Neptunomonas qingdaonensis]
MIHFLLNNQRQSISTIDPNTTVLNYLRNVQRRMGTKEGCASGDCGACTVVLAEVENGQLAYRSINSCLTLLPALNGKQLLTVEDLKEADQLHAVQQAMVDHHGSQCGFCTPGIIMSLFAYQKNASQKKSIQNNPCVEFNKAEALAALAGNLCRCTGYQPIMNAAKEIGNHHQSDKFDQQKQRTIDILNSIQPVQCHAISNAQHSTTHALKTAFSPTTLQELDELLQQHPAAQLLAGGTDLVLDITQKHQSFNTLIYLGEILVLKQINLTATHIEIGAAVPLSQCHSVIAEEYPDFGHLLERFASLQIRNQGTLGGNIANASPIGDAPPALIAAGAILQLRIAGVRRFLPIDEFFVDYRKTQLAQGEYIEKIILPRKPQDSIYRVYKISKRLDDDISAVCAAIHIKINHGQVSSAIIAFGGMAAIPKRASHCEQALLNQVWAETTIHQAMDALQHDFAPLSDFRASADYRMRAAQNILLKCWIESQSALKPNANANHKPTQTLPHIPTRVTDYV